MTFLGHVEMCTFEINPERTGHEDYGMKAEENKE
jgi:hypothetical protein